MSSPEKTRRGQKCFTTTRSCRDSLIFIPNSRLLTSHPLHQPTRISVLRAATLVSRFFATHVTPPRDFFCSDPVIGRWTLGHIVFARTDRASRAPKKRVARRS
ncbi:hypothetical protein PsYK624_085630 [Phanerochaete sordida]|uniref:Uncharacterized protein n=1 Tax=Phanerochaete sordida TaxID=48140 RepID=A0A9P3LFA1_9APHY|nr:hypothetical protein PsYK624_085630 [Phanerochaete sordida]